MCVYYRMKVGEENIRSNLVPCIVEFSCSLIFMAFVLIGGYGGFYNSDGYGGNYNSQGVDWWGN